RGDSRATSSPASLLGLFSVVDSLLERCPSCHWHYGSVGSGVPFRLRSLVDAHRKICAAAESIWRGSRVGNLKIGRLSLCGARWRRYPRVRSAPFLYLRVRQAGATSWDGLLTPCDRKRAPPQRSLV